MIIKIDTDKKPSDRDLAFLESLLVEWLGQPVEDEQHWPDTSGDTIERAVSRAEELVAAGEKARVIEALKTVKAARVSTMTPDQVPAFLKALR